MVTKESVKLTNPPGHAIEWTFKHRLTGEIYKQTALTAWLAVRQAGLSFQECEEFSRGDGG